MTTVVDYALMAGASYISNRALINRFPSPQGWLEEIDFQKSDPNSGFEATYFINGNNIVISFAGTDPSTIGDLYADGSLVLGLTSSAFISHQLLDAADYYLSVQALNPGATITFTGHSLGGGLAALMAVFFNQTAVTFDQAPFRDAATLDMANALYAYLSAETTNGQPTYSASQLFGLTSFINESTNTTNGTLANESNITDINVQGEFLSSSLDPFKRIGLSANITNIPDSSNGVSALDLHSQALLTAFEQSMQTSATGQALNDVTSKLPDLLKMIFDTQLFAHSVNTTNTTNPNFLELIVNHQAGFDPVTQISITSANNTPGDAMVTRFTTDQWAIAQAGGLTMSDKYLTDALIAFDMQKYYYEKPGSQGAGQNLFTAGTNSGYIQFDTGSILSSSGLATPITQDKGYNQYFKYYLWDGSLQAGDNHIISIFGFELDTTHITLNGAANDADYGNYRARSAA